MYSSSESAKIVLTSAYLGSNEPIIWYINEENDIKLFQEQLWRVIDEGQALGAFNSY